MNPASTCEVHVSFPQSPPPGLFRPYRSSSAQAPSNRQFAVLTPEELLVKHPRFYSDSPVAEEANKNSDEVHPSWDQSGSGGVSLDPCVDFDKTAANSDDLLEDSGPDPNPHSSGHFYSNNGGFDPFSEYQRADFPYLSTDFPHSPLKGPHTSGVDRERKISCKVHQDRSSARKSNSATPLVRISNEEDKKGSFKVCLTAVILVLIAMVVPAGMAAVGVLFSCKAQPKINLLLFIGSGVSGAVILIVAFTVVYMKRKFLAGIVLTISSCIIIAWYAVACSFVYEIYPVKNTESCDFVVLTFIFWMLNAFWLIFSPLFISTCFFMYSSVKEKLHRKKSQDTP